MSTFNWGYYFYRVLSKAGVHPTGLVARGVHLLNKRRSNNALKRLVLDTYDGSGQAVHPDVVVTDDFGGHKYWMALTPYPYGIDYYENPCLYVSDDRVNWRYKKDIPLPLVKKPKGKGNHLSDPELLYRSRDKELWLFYRQTILCYGGTRDSIYVIKTLDGTSWSEPQLILESNEYNILSPASDGNVRWI